MGVEWGGRNERRKADRRKVPSADQRWERFQEREEMYDGGDPTDHRWLQTFAERADGVLVFFDEHGWFTMEWRNVCQEAEPCSRPGHRWIYACDPDGTAHDVYCEPVWLAAYYDQMTENIKRGENDD